MNEKILVLNDKLLLADDKIICVPQAENLQNKTVDPALTSQTVIPDEGYVGLGSVVVTAIPTATQAEPSITVSSSGLITASATQTAGYVNAGTKSATEQLTVQAEQTITPGTSNKTIAADTYLTGTQTIKGDSNLIADNIKNGVSIFGVAGSLVGETIGAVSKGIITVTYPSGSACTVTNGTVTYTALDTSGAATFVVDPGTWTVTAGSKTKTVSITKEGQVEIVNLASLILYSPGDEHTAVTGGWTEESSNNYMSVDMTESGIEFYWTGNSTTPNSTGNIYTNNTIDLSNFSVLHAEIDWSKRAGYSDYAEMKVGSASTRPAGNEYVGEITLDISTISTGVIKFTAYNCSMTVHRVWLT